MQSRFKFILIRLLLFRFYIVNNLSEPRVRKLPDVADWPDTSLPPWSVLTSDRYARVLLASGDSELSVITQSDIFKPGKL